MKFSKWMIRILLLGMLGVQIWIAMVALTPTVDVFSYVAFLGTPNAETGARQTVTYTFREEGFAQEVQNKKPKAQRQDVEDFVSSIKINIEFIDPPGEWRDSEQTLDPRYRVDIVDFDKRLKRKIGIRFYCNSLQL